ncbi:hypothetical protein CHI12_18570, partial [Terribacillus saccharophilus]
IENLIEEEVRIQREKILAYKKIDSLTKLRLDYLNQIQNEEIKELSMYIGNIEGLNDLSLNKQSDIV